VQVQLPKVHAVADEASESRSSIHHDITERQCCTAGENHHTAHITSTTMSATARSYPHHRPPETTICTTIHHNLLLQYPAQQAETSMKKVRASPRQCNTGGTVTKRHEQAQRVSRTRSKKSSGRRDRVSLESLPGWCQLTYLSLGRRQVHGSRCPGGCEEKREEDGIGKRERVIYPAARQGC